MKEYGFGKSSGFTQRILIELDQALRMMIVLFERTIIPASTTFYLPEIRLLLAQYSSLFPDKLLLLGEGWSLDDYAATASSRYREGDEGFTAYQLADEHADFQFFGRQRSATREVINRWHGVGPEALLVPTRRVLDAELSKRIERQWDKVPDEIEGLAFIAPHIAPIFSGDDETSPALNNAIRLLTAGYYFESVCTEFGAYLMNDFAILNRPVGFLPIKGFVGVAHVASLLNAQSATRRFFEMNVSEFADFVISSEGRNHIQLLRTRVFPL